MQRWPILYALALSPDLHWRKALPTREWASVPFERAHFVTRGAQGSSQFTCEGMCESVGEASPLLHGRADQVELTNIAEIAIQNFHKKVDELKDAQLIIIHIHAENEEHPCVSTVDDLVASILQKVCVSWVTCHHSPVDLGLNLELLTGIERHIPLGQTGLALPVL